MTRVDATPARDTFALGSWLFLRILAIVHLIAFTSAWSQLNGLVGPHGLLPAQPFFNAVHEQLGASAYFQLPSLCWLFGAGKFLPILCAAGVALSLLLFAGIAPAPCLALLWAAYLSLCGAGQVFFNFQWDALLLETTLLAIFFAPWSLLPLWRAPEPPRLARWLLVWLFFRLMFLSGIVKLTNGDPTWRNLTALTFHYETQPLPTPLAWFVHQLPAWFHRTSCAGMFVIELIAPFCLFLPRSFRHRATLLIAVLMVLIALTGNYTFFNLLTLALCLPCLADAWWHSTFPRLTRILLPPDRPELPRVGQSLVDKHLMAAAGIYHVPRWLLGAVAVLVIPFTALQALPSITRRPVLPELLGPLENIVAPFRSLNNYGLFAVMTNPRPELVFEGSDDGREWRAYEFPDKPGDPVHRPTWVAPFQPRLDWQLWFAALGSPAQNRWVLNLCEHLLRGTPDVLALLATNPFAGKPPRFVRVVRYEYYFTDAPTRARTGQWWRRTPLDFYIQPASLK